VSTDAQVLAGVDGRMPRRFISDDGSKHRPNHGGIGHAVSSRSAAGLGRRTYPSLVCRVARHDRGGAVHCLVALTSGLHAAPVVSCHASRGLRHSSSGRMRPTPIPQNPLIRNDRSQLSCQPALTGKPLIAGTTSSPTSAAMILRNQTLVCKPHRGVVQKVPVPGNTGNRSSSDSK